MALGWKTIILASEGIVHDCPQCGGEAMKLLCSRTTLFYAHLPLLPLWRQIQLRCAKCRYEIERADMTSHDLLEVDQFAAEHGTPFWVFPASAATLILLVLGGAQVV